MVDKRCFVQLPHPGGEHRPDDNGQIGWNKKPNLHRRKFMQFRGEWTDENGNTHPGNLCAWGEWEPESKLLCKFDPLQSDSPNPRYLWKPYYVVPPEKNYRDLHNTDPFIFGNCFLYSNCGQTAESKRALRCLAPGSVIAFGSGRMVGNKRMWVLDTVLVVKDSIPYDPLNPREALKDWVPEAFLDVTGDQLAYWAADEKRKAISGKSAPPPERLRLYRGATPNNPVDEMFSFFPAKPASDDSGFPRPFVCLPDKYFKPSNWQAPKGACRDLKPEKLRCLWDLLVAQVQDAGLVLGTRAELPESRA